MCTIEELFTEYMKTAKDRINPFDEGWNGIRGALYANGVVLGKIRERDENTLKFLEKEIPEHEIKRQIKMNLERMGGNRYKYQDELKELDRLSFKEYMAKYCKWIERDVYEYKQRCVAVYLYYAYENHCHEMHLPYSQEQGTIKKIYGNLSEYNKYELIEVGDNRPLFVTFNDTRLYDAEKKVTFSLANLPKQIAKEFIELMDNRIVNTLSVRLDNSQMWDGKYIMDYVLEEVEFGKLFSLEKFSLVPLSKLYSANLNDCLWVK